MDPKEGMMFIGEVEETGVIEPVVFPHAVPAGEPARATTEIEDPVLEPAAAM